MKRILPLCVGAWLALIVAVSSSCSGLGSGGAATGSHRPTVAQIATGFTSYQKITPSPVFVNSKFYFDCGGDFRARAEQALKQYGPHADTAVMIYMNDAAAKAFAANDAAAKGFTTKLNSYPVGSVVVKQKIIRTDTIERYFKDEPESRVQRLDGVGGMVKRPAGYDPEHGDWEYFYFNTPAQIESGRIQSCVDCHAGAKSRDHVFGGWTNPPKA